MAKLYQLNGDKVAESKFGVQASLIVKALEDKQPDTVAGVAERIKNELVTRQSPERVVNFYLSTWRKKGIVSVVGEAADDTPVSTGNSSSEESTGDIADAEDAGAPKLDIVNCTNKEAVLWAVDNNPNSQVQDIHGILQVAGRTISINQVSDAVRKLVKDGHLDKDEDGNLSIPE